MPHKSLAYYFLKGAINVKPAERYMETNREVSRLAGGADGWSQRFIFQLQIHGLKLSPVFPEADERLYSHSGLPMCAPRPPENDVVQWPSETYIVWELE